MELVEELAENRIDASRAAWRDGHEKHVTAWLPFDFNLNLLKPTSVDRRLRKLKQH